MRSGHRLTLCLLVLAMEGLFLDHYAQAQGKWVTRAPMPSSRTEVAAAVLGDKIYVIGGFAQGGNLVEEYDTETDRWRRRAPLPRPLHHVGAAAVGGKVYAIGGYVTGSGSVNTVYEYDPVADPTMFFPQIIMGATIPPSDV